MSRAKEVRRILLAGGAVALLGVAAWLWLGRQADEPPGEAEPGTGRRSGAATVAPARAAPPAFLPARAPQASGDAGPESRAEALGARLWTLLAPGGPLPDGAESELAAIAAELAALGDAGARALIQRLDQSSGSAGLRDWLFDLLRRVPGNLAEQRLAQEARRGQQPSLRTMAIEALAERKTDAAFEALATVARHDPNFPAKSLIAETRDPNDPSTELPDEQVFTPRMQAMAALAGTKDARAAEVLADIVNGGPDEALRMEAARHLAEFRDHPRTLAVLRGAAAGDSSPYVRLAALHALSGATDVALSPVLADIAARDRDAGVRLLAQQVLASLRK